MSFDPVNLKQQIGIDSELSQIFQQAMEKFAEKLNAEAPVVRKKQADEAARAAAEGRKLWGTLVCLDDLLKTAGDRETFLLAAVSDSMGHGLSLEDALQAVHRDVHENHAEPNFTAE